jgi:hypothetical protein
MGGSSLQLMLMPHQSMSSLHQSAFDAGKLVLCSTRLVFGISQKGEVNSNRVEASPNQVTGINERNEECN